MRPEVMEGWPASAFADRIEEGNGQRPSTNVYEFEVRPTEMLIFPAQLWHNTTVTSSGRSFALTGQYDAREINNHLQFSGLGGEERARKFTYFHEAFWKHSRCEDGLAQAYEEKCYGEWFAGLTEDVYFPLFDISRNELFIDLGRLLKRWGFYI